MSAPVSNSRAAIRLIAAGCAVVLLIGAAWTGAHGVQTTCGPRTYGGPCSGNTVATVAMLFSGLALYRYGGSARMSWVPGVGWLAAVLVARQSGVTVSTFYLAASIAIAFATVLVSIARIRNDRRARAAAALNESS